MGVRVEEWGEEAEMLKEVEEAEMLKEVRVEAQKGIEEQYHTAPHCNILQQTATHCNTLVWVEVAQKRIERQSMISSFYVNIS